MTKVRIRTGEWVVVCDGAKALILENVGDEVFPNLHTREVRTQAQAATREAGTAAEPRRAGTKGHPAGGQDSERNFLEAVAERLEGAVRSGEVKALVLVAPPRALGIIRDASSPALKNAVRAEIDKDYVNLPVDQIERRLAG